MNWLGKLESSRRNWTFVPEPALNPNLMVPSYAQCGFTLKDMKHRHWPEMTLKLGTGDLGSQCYLLKANKKKSGPSDVFWNDAFQSSVGQQSDGFTGDEAAIRTHTVQPCGLLSVLQEPVRIF
ncbi:hypothetical protein STEG23_019288 [Scotinomys teguina]